MPLHSMRLIAKLAAISLLLTYGTYVFLLIPGIAQGFKWYIFGPHMLLIVATFFIGILGAVRGCRFCIFAMVADAPLIYAQFFS
jgi:hypothetical protein